MSEFLNQATQKIQTGLGDYKGDKYGQAMKKEVAAALEKLCRLDGEFAQAVAQGGDFAGCMAAVCKAVRGGSISDIDAYCAAAGYFFPGCKVRMNLEINLCGEVDEEAFSGTATPIAVKKPAVGIVIDLAELL